MRFLSALLVTLGLSITSFAGFLPVEDFARFERYTGMVLSPDGRTVAYIENKDEQLNLIFWDLDSGKSVGVSMPSSQRAWVPQNVRIGWANSHRLVFGLADGGFAAIEKDGTQIQGLTGRMGAIDRGDQTSVSSDGVLHFFRDEANGELLMTEYDVKYGRYDGEWYAQNHPHVMRINSRTGTKVRVLENEGNVEYWLSDSKGVVRVALESKRGIARTIYREDANASWAPLPGMDWNDTVVRPLGFSADAKTLYVNRKSPTGMWAVYPYDLVQKRFGEAIIEHEKYDIIPNVWRSFANGLPLQTLLFSSGADPVLLGARFVTDFPRVAWFHPGMDQTQTALDQALPGKINSIVSMSDDMQRMITLSWSANDPGVYYLFDAKTQTLMRLFSRMPWIDAAKMAETSAISFSARDGLLLQGYLTLPRGRPPKNLPMIVMPHGGPQTRDVWGYDPDVQFLANRGYAVLQVNYRGSSGFGQRFLDLGKRHYGDAAQHDITDGVHWAIEHGVADKNRIGIMGGSFGGYSALMGLVLEPEIYKCGINIAGVADWIELIEDKAKMFPESAGPNVAMFGHPKKDAAALKRISPVYLVDSIKAPVLLIHGRDDPAVPFSQAKAMVSALKKAGKNYEFMPKYNEQHGLHSFKNRTEMYERVDAFLKKYMPAD